MQDAVSSAVMEDGVGRVAEEEEGEQVEAPARRNKVRSEVTNNRHSWANGQCVVTMPWCSPLNPSFDLSECRTALENNGFQIPAKDLEAPLTNALDVPSVRRYMVFNSALFHFIMAPIMYVVVWCAVFSTLHVYITVTDYWVLCLTVSLISIFITTAILFILHHSNKEINMNLDVRLIQVNERMVKHKLLVAVGDWVQNCTGNTQLYFVYWDMSRCLNALTETFEGQSFAEDETQKKLKKKMSHLVLVTEEVVEADPEAAAGGSDVVGDEEERGADEEQRPLLREEGRSTPSGQREDTKVTVSYSLVPDASLPAQAKAHQLLMTYSAAYVKLLVSERLSGPSNHRLRPRRNHCTLAPMCLCQFIKRKILR